MTDQTKPPATEIARDVISNRLAIDYEDSDIAADVVTYRILRDIVAAGLTIVAAPEGKNA